MKKKAVVLFAGLLACSAMLGGCGGNQASNDYVKVGGYKGIVTRERRNVNLHAIKNAPACYEPQSLDKIIIKLFANEFGKLPDSFRLA